MSSERRYLWVATGVVVLVVLGLLVVPALREEIAPEPRSALVAARIEGSEVAEVGSVRVPSGRRFFLHAVLVAEDRSGEPVYYTEAPELRIRGEDVDPARLRVWYRSGEIAILWFTLEGYRPFLEVAETAALESFRFEESFRPEWGRGWTIAGSVTPRNSSLARGFADEEEIPFGTAHYSVRIEKYHRLGDPAPLERYRSPGAEAMRPGPDRPTTVEVTLPEELRRVSAVFGLPQLEPSSGAASELRGALKRWYAAGLAFSRLLVLGGLLEDRALTWPRLEWSQVDLSEEPVWGEISSGDLLRSGERIVVLYADRGIAGRVDYDDLCFDLAESAAVRRIGEVFTGGGVLDWTDLAPAGETRRAGP